MSRGCFGPRLARVIFGVLVGIVVGLKLVTARIKPDFADLEQREAETVAQAAPVEKPKPAGRKCDDGGTR